MPKISTSDTTIMVFLHCFPSSPVEAAECCGRSDLVVGNWLDLSGGENKQKGRRAKQGGQGRGIPNETLEYQENGFF